MRNNTFSMQDFLLALKEGAPSNIAFGVGYFMQPYIVVYEPRSISVFGWFVFTRNVKLVEITAHFINTRLYFINLLWRYRYIEDHKEFWLHLRKVSAQQGVTLAPSFGSIGCKIPDPS